MTETVVVLGASGGIGRAIVPQLVSEGHRVIAVARNAERLEALAQRVGNPRRLSLQPGSVANPAGADRLVEALRACRRPITTVVSALRGPVESARLLDRPTHWLMGALEADVLTQFTAIRVLLPLLAEAGPNGLYLVLNGPMAACAWAGYGHLSIAAAALQMLTRVIREEAKDLPVAVQELQIGMPVRTEVNRQCACPDWLDARDVARQVALLVARRDRNVPTVQMGFYASANHPLLPTNPRLATDARSQP